MPMLKVVTNLAPNPQRDGPLLRTLSSSVAALLGKSERYVMVSMEADLAMLFGGTDDALAYVELKSIGLPEDATADLSEAICGVLEEGLGVSPERIYIEFTRAERHRWGWNRRTFA